MKRYLNDKEIAKILFDWKYKGYTIVNVLSENEVIEVKDELNRLRIERNQKDESWGEFGMYSHPQKESEVILKYLGHPKILEITELLFGEETEGIQSLAYFKPAGELGRDSHQDGIYSQSGWGRSLNASISLDDSGPENGGIWLYEASHFLPILDLEVDEERTKTNPLFWKNERGKPCVMPEGHNFPLIYTESKRGDIIFVHSNCVHGSNQNNSDRTRNSIVIGYKAKSAPIRQGGLMKREPIDVYEINKKYWEK
jgi:ectoine hydroxylase-related dioxygenase (phytanoyl-CoA dioxygenase family)